MPFSVGSGSRPSPPARRRPRTGTGAAWRRDVWRDIDLVEEIARIEGYELRAGGSPDLRPARSNRSARADRRPPCVGGARGGRMLLGDDAERGGRIARGDRQPVDRRRGRSSAGRPSCGCRPAAAVTAPQPARGPGRQHGGGRPHGDLFEIAHAYLPRQASPPHDLRVESPVEEPLLAALVVGGGYPLPRASPMRCLRFWHRCRG